MYSESAYRSKVAKITLGAKYRLSREQHVAEKNVLQWAWTRTFLVDVSF